MRTLDFQKGKVLYECPGAIKLMTGCTLPHIVDDRRFLCRTLPKNISADFEGADTQLPILVGGGNPILSGIESHIAGCIG